ncbi:MAG: hypothetical protein C4321_10505, partial [Chloroflexota bacterium]
MEKLATPIPLDWEKTDLWSGARQLAEKSGARLLVRHDRPKAAAGETPPPVPLLTLHSRPIPLAQTLNLLVGASDLDWWIDAERGAIIIGKPANARQRFQAAATLLAQAIAAQKPAGYQPGQT